jgi:DNA-binding transcriptional regulator YbjK
VSSVPGVFSHRQEVLLGAAVRVVARSGLRGLTHRAVDAEAGLPEGSCSAVMRTRLALLTRLTEFVIAPFARDLQQLTQRVEEHRAADADRSGDAAYAVQQTAAMLQSWVLEPDLLLARLELTIEGSRQPALAAIGQSVSQQLVDVVEHAMDDEGPGDKRIRATALIAALDGVLLHALREEPADRAAYLRESLELLMGALVGPGQTQRLG